MENLKDIVQFWDSRNLHSFLIQHRSLLYLRYLFLNCNLVKNFAKILFDIFSCCEISPQQLESSNLNNWWKFKDRTVKVHACLQHLESFWKDRIFTIDKHDADKYRSILDSIFFSLELIVKYCSEDLVDIITEIKTCHPSNFSEYVNVVLARSNWIGMGLAKREIHNKDRATKIIDDWVVPRPRCRTEFSQIHDYLENLEDVAEALEDGVDWLFDDYLKSQNLPTLR